jgi:hypothetical protein
VWARLTRPPTGHRLHDVAPVLLLYRWRPSAEVSSHLPQAKSPPPAFAVPGQGRQCRQQVISADKLSRQLQAGTTELEVAGQTAHSNVYPWVYIIGRLATHWGLCYIVRSDMVGQLTRGAGLARIFRSRLRAWRVGDAGGVRCVHSATAGAHPGAGLLPGLWIICAPLAAAAAANTFWLEGARVAGVHRPKAVLEVARPGDCSEGNSHVDVMCT